MREREQEGRTPSVRFGHFANKCGESKKEPIVHGRDRKDKVWDKSVYLQDAVSDETDLRSFNSDRRAILKI